MSSSLSSIMHYNSFTFQTVYYHLKRLYIGFQFIISIQIILQRTLTDLLSHLHIPIFGFFLWFAKVESARAHPPSKPKKAQKQPLRRSLSGCFCAHLVCYYSDTFIIILILLSMSSVLSSLMHYISFTLKQSFTALSNACSSAFNLFISFLLTSTYSHRC